MEDDTLTESTSARPWTWSHVFRAPLVPALVMAAIAGVFALASVIGYGTKTSSLFSFAGFAATNIIVMPAIALIYYYVLGFFTVLILGVGGVTIGKGQLPKIPGVAALSRSRLGRIILALGSFAIAGALFGFRIIDFIVALTAFGAFLRLADIKPHIDNAQSNSAFY